MAHPITTGPLGGLPPGGSPTSDEVSPLVLVAALLRHRAVVFGTALALFTVVVVVGLLVPRTYTSTLSFLPQVRKTQTAGLSGIAAQFGLAVSDGDAGQSPTFYGDLVLTSEILRGLVETRYRYLEGADSVRGTLVDVYRITSGTPLQRRDAAMKQLKESMAVGVNGKTGVVSVAVTTRNAYLSQLIGQRLLELLGQFNQQRRQSQAAAERQFAQQRMTEARAELNVAEENLQGFLVANREFRNSPTLTFQQERLNREVMLRQQLYTGLAQAYEQAKIDEVRDTPLLTIVEPAALPSRPDARGLAKKGILALVLGFVLGILVALGRETLWRARRRRDGAFDELAVLLQQSVDDVKRPWRPLLRSFRSRPAAMDDQSRSS